MSATFIAMPAPTRIVLWIEIAAILGQQDGFI